MANADLSEHHSPVASYQERPCQLLYLIPRHVVSSSRLVCPAFDLWLNMSAMSASVRQLVSGGSRDQRKRAPEVRL